MLVQHAFVHVARRAWWKVATVALTVGLGVSPCRGQGLGELEFPAAAAAEGKLTFSFDKTTEDWRGLDPDNKIAVETNPLFVRAGQGSLRYDYPLQKDVMCIVCRGNLSVAGAQSISLWIKTDRQRMFGLGVFEADGSNYFTLFSTRPNAWLQVAYDFAEMHLAEDSTDENGQLDADQITTVGLVDAELFGVGKGIEPEAHRTVWIDEVSFSPMPSRPPVENGRAVLDDFETPNGRWSAVEIAGGGRIGVTRGALVKTATDPALVKEGKGALEYRYRPSRKSPSALFGSVSLRLKQPRSLSFWLRTSHPTIVACILSEQDGSRYLASVSSTSDKWRHVQLSLADFALDDDATDENKQLDGDQVNSLGFVDAAAMFGAVKEDEERTLWLDSLTADQAEAPPRHPRRPTPGGVEVLIDDFEGGAADWLALTLVGGEGVKPVIAFDPATKLHLTADEAARGKAVLRADYFAPEASVVALLRIFSQIDLTGVETIRFWLKSRYDAKLLIGVEERDGSGYNKVLDVPGGEKWQRHELPLSDLKLADDKVDENGRLDVEQLKQLMVLDLSGATGEPGPNVLWIDDLTFFCPERPK